MLIQVIGKFPFVLFLFAIVLSVLRNADSDYPFGIFKLFFAMHGIFFFISRVSVEFHLTEPALQNFILHLKALLC